MTKILIKSPKDLLFTRKLGILQILIENSSFEKDPQLNLRFLYLLYRAFRGKKAFDSLPQQSVTMLVNFLLSNINKFRSILESKESYFIEIPKL